MRLLPSLLLALVTAVSTVAHAGVPPMPQGIAAVPPERLAERIASAHSATDQALAARKAAMTDYAARVKLRDAAAKAVDVEKRRVDAGAASRDRLTTALEKANRLDEDVQRARALVLSREQDVAAAGTVLLALYDALLVEKRRDIERAGAADARRPSMVDAYRRFSTRRDDVKSVLAPVLAVRDSGADARRALVASVDDDAEALLEKADLARDLERRLTAKADLIRRRILELEAERSLARDVTGLTRTGVLFEETDRRLQATAGAAAIVGRGPMRAINGLNFFGARSSAASGAENAPMAADTDDDGAVVAPGNGQDGNAPPPRADVDGDGALDPNTPTEVDDNFAGGESPQLGVDKRNDDVTNVTRGTGGETSRAIGPSEQVFLSGRDGRTADVLDPSTSEMSLEQLQALERKLRTDAKTLKKQGDALRGAATRDMSGASR